MAEIGFPLLCILFTLSLPSILSRSHLPTSTGETSELDVSASIQKTLDVLSFTPRPSQSLMGILDSLVTQHEWNPFKPGVDLAVNGVRKADLKPVDTELAAEDLEVPVISVTSTGYSAHPAAIATSKRTPFLSRRRPPPTLRSPATLTSANLSTFQSAETAPACTKYPTVTGSYTVGDFVTETVTLEGSTAVQNIAIGCGHNNEGLFVGAAGLIGLGGGALSFPSQINATSYSYCLVDRDSDSASTLDFNSPTPHDAITAPLLRSTKLDTFYYVGLRGLSVAGQLLHIPSSTFQLTTDGNAGVIVDSGTAVTRLQTVAYNALRDAFVKGTKGAAVGERCGAVRYLLRLVGEEERRGANGGVSFLQREETGFTG
ncbi:unnamed protein product [Lactuca saligna]|uniref:Peptidase A1 domain-containing protein n=1 Tax=Lactuca saligna TaxID=75948 RepID=A0AA36E0G7_LACSI|nr:unnamed protein product [Lactuca saligna]